MPQLVALAVAIGEAASGAIATGAMAVGVGADTAIALGNFAVNFAVANGLGSLATGLMGSTGGVQERAASGALTTRRMLVGKVWTAGSFATDPPISYDASNKKAFQVIWLGDHECDGLEQIYVDGYPASLGSYDSLKGWQVLYTTDPTTGHIVKDFRVGQPKFYAKFYSGADGQAADPWMVQELSGLGKWDSTCVGKNVCYLIVYAYYDSDIFSRWPEFQVFLRGAKLYNPAKDSTAGGSGPHRWGVTSTYEWSANWAVIAYNLCRGFYVGGKLFYGAGYDAEDLPMDNWLAAIAACDEEVALKAGGTEPRYHGGCEFDVTKEVREALKTCEEATAGEICTFGAVTMFPGVSQTPVFTFSDSDMAYQSDGAAHPQSWDPRAAIDDVKNIFEGKYLDVGQQFALNDIPPRYSNDDIVACGGIPLRETIQLSQIQSCATAQRILEVRRKKSMAQGAAVRTFLSAALNAKIGEWVAGTSIDWGNTTKWFQIRHIKLNEDSTVTMSLREIAADLDDWTPANDELASFGVSLPSSLPPDPLLATGITAAALSELGDDGSASAGFAVSFDPVDDPTAASVVVRWRLLNSNVVHYVESTDLQSGTVYIRGLAGETTFQYSVLISGIIGRTAMWSDWFTVTTPSSQQAGINDANGTALRDVFGILDSLVQSLNETAMADVATKSRLMRRLQATKDNLTASFTEQITAEVTAREALASQVTVLDATVGQISAEGLFAVDVKASADGASSVIGLRSKVANSSVQATAALLLKSEIVDGVGTSEVDIVARKVRFLADDGTGVSILDPVTGLITTDGISHNAITDLYGFDVLTPTYNGASGHDSNSSPWVVGDRTNPLFTRNSFYIHQSKLQSFLPSGSTLLGGILTNGYSCKVRFSGTWRSSTSSLTHIEVAVIAGTSGLGPTFVGAAEILDESAKGYGMNNTDISQEFSAEADVPGGYSAFWPVIYAPDHDVWIDVATLSITRHKTNIT